MQEKIEDPNLDIQPQGFAKQSHQFWFLQLCGWIGYALVVFVAIIRPQFSDPSFNFSGQLLNLAVETFSGFFLSYLQWQLIQKTVHLSLKRTLFYSFASATLFGLVFNTIKLASFKKLIYGQIWYEQLNMLEFGGWFLFSVSTMYIWTAIFFIMLYNTRLKNEHEMLLRAKNSAKEAQLQMLRYQLNPHFMFNTMNAISTLIYKNDNAKAGEMLDKLCDFFRYSLDQNTDQLSSLSKELELMSLYLSIEKVRFGDRLQVTINVADHLKSAKVPSLLLQPIVENAVKYGIESQKRGGEVSITISQENEALHIQVFDTGSGEINLNDSGFGIGLKNTRERLTTLFSDKASVDIEHIHDGTVVNLVMPFMR